jgi:hypothetical protein
VPASTSGRRFQAPPAIGQPLPTACAAELWDDGEIFDSNDDNDDDDDDLPSVGQILAPPKQVIKVVDLTRNDDGDSEGDDGNHTEVSWLRYARTAQHHVRLTSPLTDRFRVADQLPLPPTVLSAKLTGTHGRRPHNVIYGGPTWQEETPLEECPSVVPIVPQTSTAF